jgi:hypothetical protein
MTRDDASRLAELCKNDDAFRKADPAELQELLRLLREMILNGVKPVKPTTEKARRPRRASPTQAQVRNVVKAAMNAGLAVSRVEIVNGKITVFAGELTTTSEEPGDDLDRELADFEARHGQV